VIECRVGLEWVSGKKWGAGFTTFEGFGDKTCISKSSNSFITFEMPSKCFLKEPETTIDNFLIYWS